MNILEFIEQYYPIMDRVKDKLSDPYKRIAEMDDLPYDKIGPDENGHVTKLVEVDETTYISVAELISYSEEDIKKMEDEALKNVWYAYMDNVDIMDLNFVDLQECVRSYLSQSEKRKEQLDVLSVQKI